MPNRRTIVPVEVRGYSRLDCVMAKLGPNREEGAMYLKSLSPEQTTDLVTVFAGKFRGQLPFDELVLHPGTAARFIQDYS